ncbi:MAG: hemoblobin-interacting domain-containing protein [Intestinibacillus sp.]
MNKRIISAVIAACCALSSYGSAAAASVEVYGQTKMNLWDFYLTENNAERPDMISTATVDVVSQATYNPYDNLPVKVETGMDMNLLADSTIIKAYGIQNDSVERILQTWNDGYRTVLLGSVREDVQYPVERSIVKYTSNDGTSYYFPYSLVQTAIADVSGFDWETFAKEAAEAGAVIPPYQVKYLLEKGEFGKRALINASGAETPPTLTLDEEYGNLEENAGKFIKLNFGNNQEWADKVYAIKVNETGLIAGNMNIKTSYTDHSGDTNFLPGQSRDPKNNAELLIRINQKFRLGENKLVFMADGYKDAEFTLHLDKEQSAYPWMVTLRVLNKDKEADATGAELSDFGEVKRGNVLAVEATGSVFSGKYDSILIDGKELPAEDITKGTHLPYYSYANTNGTKLHVYTSGLPAGIHELHLKKQGYNDVIRFFTVTEEGHQPVPAFTVQGETLTVNGETYTGGSVAGQDIVMKSAAGIADWYHSVLHVFYRETASGKIYDVTDQLELDSQDDTKVTLESTSLSYWTARGEHSILVQAKGYDDVALTVKRVKAMPEITASYRQTDGSVTIWTKDSSYLTASNLLGVVVGGTAHAVSNFEITGSYSSGYTLAIPSEYFEKNTAAEIKLTSGNYSDYIAKIQIPETHVKRIPAPAVTLSTQKAALDSKLTLTFEDDPTWRQNATVVLKDSSGTNTTNFKSLDSSQPGILSGTIYSYASKGSYTLVVSSPGYQDVRLPVEIVNAVPGTVQAAVKEDDSVTISLEGSSYSVSTYISAVSVLVNGTAVASEYVTKTSPSLTLSKACFPQAGVYQVKLTASGYADYTLQVDTSAVKAPTLTVNGQTGEGQPLVLSFDENPGWAQNITGVAVIKSSGSTAIAKDSLLIGNGMVTVPAQSLTGLTAGDYTYVLKISAQGYRDAEVSFKIYKAVPSGISASVVSSGGADTVRIALVNYTYANAVQQIKIGGTTLQRNVGFTVDSSNYVASVPATYLTTGDNAVTLAATGYLDCNMTVANSFLASPAVTLPNILVRDEEIAIASDDSDWLNAVTKIEISKSSGMAELTAFHIDGARLVISETDIKAQSLSAGTGKTIRIYADGYRTMEFTGLTVYGKAADAFDRTVAWDNGKLTIDLTETGTSYGYYSVGSVYVNETKLASYTHYSTAYSKPYKLTINKEVFDGYLGQTVTIRIVPSTSYNYPELVFSVAVPTA